MKKPTSDLLVVTINGGVLNNVFGSPKLVGTRLLLVDWDNIKEGDPVGESEVIGLGAMHDDTREIVTRYEASAERAEPPGNKRYVVTFVTAVEKLNGKFLYLSAPNFHAATVYAMAHIHEEIESINLDKSQGHELDAICDRVGEELWVREDLWPRNRPPKSRKRKT